MTEYAWNRINRIYRHAMRLIFLCGIPIYGIFAAFSPLLLRIWLGDRYVEALPPAFRIMLVGAFSSLLGVPAYYTLMAIGLVRHNFLSNFFLSTVSAGIAISYVIISSTISVNMVVLSTSIGMAVSTVYLIWQKHKVVHFLSTLYLSGCADN